VALRAAVAQPITVITVGGTYTLNSTATGSDFSSPNVLANTREPVTITNSVLVTAGWGIIGMIGSNITVSNTILIYNGTPATLAVSSALIYVSQPGSLAVTNCDLVGPTGGVRVASGHPKTTIAPITIAQSDFMNCYNAIQLAGVAGDPNCQINFNRITEDQFTLHSDLISIFESSGLPNQPIVIKQNFVESSPDAPQAAASADIQAGDLNSAYIRCDSNVCLNGSQAGISVYYANSNTSSCVNNIVIGIGYSRAYPGPTYGLGMWPGAGIAAGNKFTWWDPPDL
jgi:hypothetical protein